MGRGEPGHRQETRCWEGWGQSGARRAGEEAKGLEVGQAGAGWGCNHVMAVGKGRGLRFEGVVLSNRAHIPAKK